MDIKDYETAKTNKSGVNVKIKAHILDEESMKAAGFRHVVGDGEFWSYFKDLGSDIEFHVKIPVRGELRIDVLDEWYCQPYDYQYMIHSKATHKLPYEVFERVEEEMQRLKDFGILEGHEYGEYI